MLATVLQAVVRISNSSVLFLSVYPHKHAADGLSMDWRGPNTAYMGMARNGKFLERSKQFQWTPCKIIVGALFPQEMCPAASFRSAFSVLNRRTGRFLLPLLGDPHPLFFPRPGIFSRCFWFWRQEAVYPWQAWQRESWVGLMTTCSPVRVGKELHLHLQHSPHPHPVCRHIRTAECHHSESNQRLAGLAGGSAGRRPSAMVEIERLCPTSRDPAHSRLPLLHNLWPQWW